MARADLSAMLGKLDEAPTPAPPVTRSPRATAPIVKKSPPATSDESAQAGYKAFERKETRLRSDQYADLTEMSRRLNRAKGTGGVRITENTLIRVAIDLLIQSGHKLVGATEDELRKSVGL